MTEISRRRFLRFIVLIVSITAQLISVCSDDSANSKIGTKTESHSTSKSHTGTSVFVILLVFAAAALLSFFLFRFWQKKKREEQYARLLKLFEEDDELEVELGLRD